MIERFKSRHNPPTATRGAAMIAIIILGVVLTSIIAISTSNSVAEFDRSTRNARRQASFQAAEAGVEDYVSKLTQDGSYFLNWSIRRNRLVDRRAMSPSPAAMPWTGDGAWIYPTSRNRLAPATQWVRVQHRGLASCVGTIRIVAIGRKVGSTTEERVLEVRVRPASIADYAYVSNPIKRLARGRPPTARSISASILAGQPQPDAPRQRPRQPVLRGSGPRHGSKSTFRWRPGVRFADRA